MPKTRVNVYRLGRNYGGSEEGGWYYDTGTPVFSLVVECPEAAFHAPLDADEATSLALARAQRVHEAADEVAVQLRLVYPDQGHRYSVAPQDDDYRVVVEHRKARFWPEVRPRYE